MWQFLPAWLENANNLPNSVDYLIMSYVLKTVYALRTQKKTYWDALLQ